MIHKYLTPNKKNTYMKDFNTNVLTSNDEYWGLDNGLKDILVCINENPLVQTLYSKNYNDADSISYLMLAIDKKYQKRLNSIIQTLDENLPYFSSEIRQPIRFNNKVTIPMGCNTNIDYFNITVFYLKCESLDIKDHKQFWLFLKNILLD
jgi:hypothetical protein